MRITFSFSLLSVNGTLFPVDGQPGCFTLGCGLFGLDNEDFCMYGEDGEIADDPVLSVQGQSGNSVNACNPTTAYLYQLIEWDEELFLKYGTTYTNSELYTEYIIPYLTDPRAKCAYITFCTNDFHILSAPDFDYVSCNDGTTTCEALSDCNEAYYNQDNDSYVTYSCYDPYGPPGNTINTCPNEFVCCTEVPGYYVWIFSDFPGFFPFTGSGSDESRHDINERNKEILNTNYVSDDSAFPERTLCAVFPNPTFTNFSVYIKTDVGKSFALSLFRSDGTLVRQENRWVEDNIAIPEYLPAPTASGVYFLKIFDGQKLVNVQKVIKI